MVETSLMKLTEILGAEAEIRWYLLGTVPEQAVFQLVAGRRVMDIEGRVIRGHLIQDAAKHGKIRDHTGVIFP